MTTHEESFMTNREMIREMYHGVNELKSDMILLKDGTTSNRVDINQLKKANNKWMERGLAGGIAIAFSSITHMVNNFLGK